jgi:hypothetical protein
VAVEVAAAKFREAYETATMQTSQQIFDIARAGCLRESITWQKRRVIHTAVDRMNPPSEAAKLTGSKQRQHELLVANYL